MNEKFPIFPIIPTFYQGVEPTGATPITSIWLRNHWQAEDSRPERNFRPGKPAKIFICKRNSLKAPSKIPEMREPAPYDFERG